MLLTLFKAFIVIIFTVLSSLLAILSIPFDPKGRVYHGIAHTWGKFVLWIFGVKVIVKGLENIDTSKHYVYVSNHASMFDIPAVLAVIPDQIRLVLKKELTRIPIWGWALKIGHYITIDRANAKDAMESLDRAAEKIRAGASVLVFAEGTRTKDGTLQPFKRGAFALAARSGVSIVPVTIKNSFNILPKGSWKIRPSDILLVIDKPIESGRTLSKEAEMKLMEQVHSVIEKNFVEQL